MDDLVERISHNNFLNFGKCKKQAKRSKTQEAFASLGIRKQRGKQSQATTFPIVDNVLRECYDWSGLVSAPSKCPKICPQK
ncbi:hypothetical protein OUZ56_011857 [Daphnia magna]|uniref:Uncharacterized protein n=1 Tax=Daphnia magna TaxID=35525 RepID=A0ABQ9Z1F5_9CRUS|nr:hypothetical protein OUZ56_011857 [Daphnia magna]